MNSQAFSKDVSSRQVSSFWLLAWLNYIYFLCGHHVTDFFDGGGKFLTSKELCLLIRFVLFLSHDYVLDRKETSPDRRMNTAYWRWRLYLVSCLHSRSRRHSFSTGGSLCSAPTTTRLRCLCAWTYIAEQGLQKSTFLNAHALLCGRKSLD